MMTTAHRYLLADVFTDQAFGGNPLAVFPDAATIPPSYMPKIAKELNLSETVFVLPPADATRTAKLRILTPDSELPFAGHPTVGAACLLAELGRVPMVNGKASVVFEEGVGPIEVTVEQGSGPLLARFSVARLPEFGPAPPTLDAVAAMLALTPADIVAGEAGPVAVSCGVPFLFVPLTDTAALGRARLDLGRWQSTLASFWAPHVYVFTRQTGRPATIRARMFAPAMGIVEDPATGAGAAALAGYLGRHTAGHNPSLRFIIEQGIEMGRPSTIELDIERVTGAATAVRVGGRCVHIGTGELLLAD